MADIPADLLYTREHEWLRPDATDPDVVTIGISDYAQHALGDIVMVELPEVGDTFDRDQPFGTVESPKSVSDVFAPASGEVIAINEDLEDAPEAVNESPYEEGWMVKIKLADPSDREGLMDAAAYTEFVASLDE